MSAITAKASRKMKKYAVLTREPRCFLGSFDFSWEQRKLGEIGSVSMCRRIFKEQTSETGDIPFYKIGTFGADPDAFISRELFEEYKSKYPYPQKGDILISASGSIGRTVEFAGNNEYFQDSNIVWLNHDERLSNPFLKCFYSVVKWAGIEGSTIKRLYNDNILNTVICMPSVPEQKRIGLFFENLDNLITLHQRKCANLCSPSQVVFSLLFATSTFSWEQRKLSEMCGTFEYGLNAAAKEFDGKNKYIRITDIDDASREFLLSDLSSPDICLDGMSKYLLSSGDIVFARTGASVGKTYIYRENDGIVYFAGFLIRAKVNQDNDAEFVFQSTLSPSYEKYIRITSQRSGQPGVNAQEYSEYDLFAPSKEEQQRIGHFLRGIDNLITLHQRECISFTGRADRLILTANKKRTTSSWEQRKFGEITSKYEDPVPTPHDGYYRLGIRSHAKGTFHSYVAKGQELETAQMHRVAAGNFIVNITFGWEHAVAITDKNDAGKLVSHRFPQFSFAEGMVPEFFRYVIVDEKFRHHLWLASPGGAGRNRVLKLDEMLNYLMRFPSRDEQIKIAEFFRHLDNLITLHQRKPFLMKWRTSDANRNQTNRLVL